MPEAPLLPRAHSTWQFRKLVSSFTPDFRFRNFPAQEMTISDTLPIDDIWKGRFATQFIPLLKLAPAINWLGSIFHPRFIGMTNTAAKALFWVLFLSGVTMICFGGLT